MQTRSLLGTLILIVAAGLTITANAQKVVKSAAERRYPDY